MRVLVGFECSGRVRDAFTKRGHDAWSCDIQPSETAGQHFQEDIFAVLEREEFDIGILHPPCDDVSSSGAHVFWRKGEQQKKAIDIFYRLVLSKLPKIAIENPVGILSTRIHKPTQYIQPYWFGDPESKRTCLWLYGLPPLKPTNMVEPEWYRNPDGSIYRTAKGARMSETAALSFNLPTAERKKMRSRTYQGIADAMAEQWG